MDNNDIVGKKYGRLTVISFSHLKISSCPNSKAYMKYYLCKCDCGKEKIVIRGNLLSGKTLSCGCLQKERAIKATQLPDDRARLHKILSHMIFRCEDNRSNRYHRYGERGITVCDEWKNDKEAFCKWALSNGYKPGLTIDRIDNDKGYSPDNCRWVTTQEQSLNTSTNVNITYNGKTQTLKEWARELGIKNTTLHNRIHYYGWSIEKAFTTPVRPY